MKTNFTESRQFFNGRSILLKKSLLALMILTLLSVTRISAQTYVNLDVAPRCNKYNDRSINHRAG